MGLYSADGIDPVEVWCPSRDTAGNGTTTLTGLVNGNNGTLMNMASPSGWVSQTDAGGVRALFFDGSNDYVLLPDFSALSAWSISVWVQSQSTAGFPSPIFLKIGTNQFNGIIGYNSDRWVPVRNDSHPANKGVVRTQNVWQHLVATWSGSSLALYLNAVLGTVGPGDAGYGITGSRIGDGYSSTKFRGWIDDARLYPQVITPTAISYLHADGLGRGIQQTETTYLSEPEMAGGITGTMTGGMQ